MENAFVFGYFSLDVRSVRAVDYARLGRFPHLNTGEGTRGSSQFGLEFVINSSGDIF